MIITSLLPLLIILSLNSTLSLLYLLFMLALFVAFSLNSPFLTLLFMLVYIGGILVLVIFSSLCSLNSSASFSTLALALPFLAEMSWSSSYEVGDLDMMFVLFLLSLLLMFLFLLLQILRS